MDSLQFLLIAGIIFMALINAASLIWASYLDHKLRQRPIPKHYDIHIEGTKVFSEIDLSEFQQQAKLQLQQEVQAAAVQLQKSVAQSANQIADNINDMATTNLSQEFQKYQVSLSELQSQTIAELGQLQNEIEQRRAQLFEQMERDIAREREKRMEHFNERINDVVASYLAESLGNKVDLGTQGVYILQVLEEHKEDIKRDVLT